MSKKRIIGVLITIVIFILFILSGRMVQQVDADEIVIIQDPIDGELHFHTVQGLKWQNFGSVTKYHKESQYWFSLYDDQGRGHDQSIKIRFNDGGHAKLSGSVRWRMPLDTKSLLKIHTSYGGHSAVEQALVRTVIEKSVYMTGPLMSSKESYAERRNDLISFISDQASGGVYKTTTRESKGIDPLSGKLQTITVVEPVQNEAGDLERQELSPLEEHSIMLYNLSINSVVYDTTVENQIRSQQQAIMDVQTAIAEAKKAEQDAIKAEEQGKANAATAKWLQEVIRAKEVTLAEQKKDVARLASEAAAFTKLQNILLGEGEAERKRLVLSADGALTQKLETYEVVQGKWADAFAKYGGDIVPQWQTTGAGGDLSGNNSMQMFMQLMMAQAAKDLSLNLEVPKGRNK